MYTKENWGCREKFISLRSLWGWGEAGVWSSWSPIKFQPQTRFLYERLRRKQISWQKREGGRGREGAGWK